MRLLVRASLLNLARQRLQCALAVTGIALGVAVVTAMHVVEDSARRAFDAALGATIGRATDQVLGHDGPFDERVLATVRRVAPSAWPQPVVAGGVTHGAGDAARVLHLIGIDVYSTPPAVAGRGFDARALVLEPGAVVLTAATAAALGVGRDASFTVRVQGRNVSLHVVEVLRADSGVQLADDMLLTDPGVDVPRPARALPPLPRPRGGPRVVYFPSCLTRIAGEETGALPRAQALLDVLFAAGFDAAYPPGVARLCCGLAFQSKGFPGAAARAARRTAKALRGFGPGALVVTDASPCALALGEAVPELEALDFAPFWARHGLPRIGAARRLPGRVVLHPTCATDRSGGVLELLGVARAHAEEVVVPDAVGCCGFAGDRGFVRPELTRSATRDEAAEVVGLAGERHVSTTRSCEIGLERASGRRYTSLIHLVRESLLG